SEPPARAESGPLEPYPGLELDRSERGGRTPRGGVRLVFTPAPVRGERTHQDGREPERAGHADQDVGAILLRDAVLVELTVLVFALVAHALGAGVVDGVDAAPDRDAAGDRGEARTD